MNIEQAAKELRRGKVEIGLYLDIEPTLEKIERLNRLVEEIKQICAELSDFKIDYEFKQKDGNDG